uniref:Putative secreted peptide n=1 Tax=Anopheles braziliensis TaxID=58242 RepID=A0A2M3ZN96_9DIPT
MRPLAAAPLLAVPPSNGFSSITHHHPGRSDRFSVLGWAAEFRSDTRPSSRNHHPIRTDRPVVDRRDRTDSRRSWPYRRRSAPSVGSVVVATDSVDPPSRIHRTTCAFVFH